MRTIPIAAYLNAVIEAGDMAELAHALGLVARARGMSEIPKASGITREALYKALRPSASPRFDHQPGMRGPGGSVGGLSDSCISLR